MQRTASARARLYAPLRGTARPPSPPERACWLRGAQIPSARTERHRRAASRRLHRATRQLPERRRVRSSAATHPGAALRRRHRGPSPAPLAVASRQVGGRWPPRRPVAGVWTPTRSPWRDRAGARRHWLRGPQAGRSRHGCQTVRPGRLFHHDVPPTDTRTTSDGHRTNGRCDSALGPGGTSRGRPRPGRCAWAFHGRCECPIPRRAGYTSAFRGRKRRRVHLPTSHGERDRYRGHAGCAGHT